MKIKIFLMMLLIIMPTWAIIGCLKKEGFLEGHVSIGPLCPVEPCNINQHQLEKIYDARNISIYSENKILVKHIKLTKTGDYKVALNPGRYVVDTIHGIGGSKDLPKEIKIESGKIIRLNIDIDTGIR